ncbi:type II toxin-antitoxin system death-on-curing family toxin [Phormidium yuhuli AB48]|uniref:Type II toxin-antitoxin system death-on-curing family toxin n=1 Tax=Phormidium yuhuli AB48 TaxID=2940671 RepID=A0ABY5ARQ5_9CYAN|nr:type II toxin-antitoxin system death-on-curing family toxin [Phormidium yuhuli]USR91700.1 type II toxin-antitoxin system death-on-curing family toxin [Phormidium yuhuli AB48]
MLTPDLTPQFIEKPLVLAIHDRQIEKFGGRHGLRDEGLLDSALAQPKASFSEKLLHPTISEQAAAYLFHLIMNHPFVDGNKRTSFAVMDTFLRLNQYALELTNEQSYELVMLIAEGNLGKSGVVERLKSSIIVHRHRGDR